MAENKTTKNSDNMTAALCFIALFVVLILIALFSSSHPLDFMVGFLTKLTGYLFLIAVLCIVAGVFLYYWKLGSDDPDKTLSESTKDNLEYTKDVTSGLKEMVKNYYGEYQSRVKEAEEEQKVANKRKS